MDNTGGEEMSRIRQIILCAAPALLLTCCRPGGNGRKTEGSLALLPGGPAWGALFQQRAAEYRGLCYQAYNIATRRLDEEVEIASVLPRAIITDIDETVLDNSPYFVERAKAGQAYSDASWIRWTARRQCDTVPGAVQFLRHAKEAGVTVFYVTNRFAAEEAQTLDNLRKFDLPDVDAAHLFLVDGTGSSKERRRTYIRNRYNVILLLGDNLGDFSAVFDDADAAGRNRQVIHERENFGSRFILFPNAMYGAWEDVLYKQEDTAIAAKNSVLDGLLR